MKAFPLSEMRATSAGMTTNKFSSESHPRAGPLPPRRCYPALCTDFLSTRYAQVFPNRTKLLHLSWDISCMHAFFLDEFCIVLLPAHPGAPSRGVLIGGAGAAPADGLASHLREPRGCCPALLRGLAIGGSSPPDECGRKPAGSGGRKVGPVVVGAVPAAKIAAVERREASVSRGRLRRLRKLVYGARRAPRLASVELLTRLSALRSLGSVPGKKKQAHPSPDKTRAMTLGCLTL